MELDPIAASISPCLTRINALRLVGRAEVFAPEYLPGCRVGVVGATLAASPDGIALAGAGPNGTVHGAEVF